MSASPLQPIQSATPASVAALAMAQTTKGKPNSPQARPQGQTKTTQFGSSTTFAPSAAQALGLKTKGVLSGIFQPVLENFLVGIMIIDFFAVWLPRIWNSLTRGAYDYNPDKDPSIQGKTGLNRKMHIWGETAKRLNWANGIEETWREALSGPLLFIWPTVFFSVAKKYYGKKALEMPYGTMTQFADTFGNQLKHASKEGFDFTDQTKTFIKNLFTDKKLLASKMVAPTHTGSKLAGHLKPTYGEFFKSWSDKLVDTLHQVDQAKTSGLKNQATKALDTLGQQFVEAVEAYNRHYHADSKFMKYSSIPVKLVERTANGGAKWSHEAVDAAGLFENLTQWHDFTKQVNKSQGTKVLETLPKVVEKVRKNIASLKTGYTLGILLFTTAFLFQFTKITQSYGSYQANRRIPLDKDGKPAKDKDAKATWFSLPNSSLPRSSQAKSNDSEFYSFALPQHGHKMAFAAQVPSVMPLQYASHYANRHPEPPVQYGAEYGGRR